ncbi:serine/threonine-protein kinase [Nannocystis pusilla]|uniref:serine/threonine-protein kinase n=1 Tax=Nannocystis pusilla TaxID=889268 RepID=UPI003B775831
MPAIWHAPGRPAIPISTSTTSTTTIPRRTTPTRRSGAIQAHRADRAGGTSTVYRAEDTRTGSKVAVKILHSSLHERLLGYFGQEGRVAARHSNPHVIQAFDFGCDEGCAFTVFKFVDGVSLWTLARRGPMPWQRVCRIALHILSALHELHGAGIIHNDLHPSNVMLRQDIADADFAVVIDFGFATVLPSTKITNAPVPDDTVYGLRRYIAPERCAGCPPDPRSDLYALGVLMWEVLTTQTIPDFMVAPGKIAVPTLAMIAPGSGSPRASTGSSCAPSATSTTASATRRRWRRRSVTRWPSRLLLCIPCGGLPRGWLSSARCCSASLSAAPPWPLSSRSDVARPLPQVRRPSTSSRSRPSSRRHDDSTKSRRSTSPRRSSLDPPSPRRSLPTRGRSHCRSCPTARPAHRVDRRSRRPGRRPSAAPAAVFGRAIGTARR